MRRKKRQRAMPLARLPSMSAELPFKNAPRVGGMDVGGEGSEGRQKTCVYSCCFVVGCSSVAFLSQSPPKAESPIPAVPLHRGDSPRALGFIGKSLKVALCRGFEPRRGTTFQF